jgi:hypothetical protein
MEENIMQKITRQKDILMAVIGKLRSEKEGFCRVRHKQGWLDFLRDGDSVFTPQELHRVLREVVESDQMKPRGEKLFFLRQHFNFTAKADGIPYRTEEALERFVVVSNKSNFYNQVPIGGGKESIDIGIKENDSKFIFIELKPWESDNSPLYAMIESLKNLIEYRTILDQGIKDIPRFDQIDLIILAPKEYYQGYQLLDDSGKPVQGNLLHVGRLLKAFSSEFGVGISFRYLELDKQSFFDRCRSVYKARGLKGQKIVCLESIDSIQTLAFERWKIW